jgi:hypothetical protein
MKFKSFNIVKMCLTNKIKSQAGKFLYQNFATIISVRSTVLLEKGRVRIWEAQNHTDPLISIWIRIQNTGFHYSKA